LYTISQKQYYKNLKSLILKPNPKISPDHFFFILLQSVLYPVKLINFCYTSN